MIRHLRITVDGTPYDVTVEDLDTPDLTAASPALAPPAPRALPAAPAASLPRTSPSAGMATGDGVIPCPLAGTVVSVEVAVGQSVAAGDVLVVLEAMKMNTPISAPRAGTVHSLAVSVGQTVTEGQPLLTLS
ncbi:acetyl-CoA carboxylase biotin carboxyl carrier protein subunit [Pararhodospirillum photometricum]|uniref:Biotin/lipoyl attachment n=1 Tax=Pararhodospirillum photometricum DSM 122 TaxID=1150469 RepID=H6SNH1_PARPM|nr:acetyl-CoA carboxylase biotin carboxyl carrier protein subunit [Pararhodospirillum photometricum]CCG09302.1 Biotin/lipoyl attachment [Pararhodospirillum photometricum DSM 122]